MNRVTISLIVFATLDALYCAPIDLTTSSSNSSALSTNNSTEVPGQATDPYDPRAFYSLDRFEGDILGSYPEQKANFYHAISDFQYLWPGGLLVYEIDSSLANHKQLIQNAMNHITQLSGSCIKFKERSDEADYVYIYQNQGCYSQVGRHGGPQELSLGRGCHVPGVVIHELLHALGFYHHHSRSDRDDYLKVNYENINPQAYPQFQKLNDWENTLYTGFDYGSIMIYGSTAFSKDGYSKTMTPTKQTGITIQDPGYKFQMTSDDVMALKKLYRCESEESKKPGPDKGGEKEKNEQISKKIVIPTINPHIRPIWPTGYPWPKDDVTTQTTSFPFVTLNPFTSPSTPSPFVTNPQPTDVGVSVVLPDGSILTPPPPNAILDWIPTFSTNS